MPTGALAYNAINSSLLRYGEEVVKLRQMVSRHRWRVGPAHPSLGLSTGEGGGPGVAGRFKEMAI